MGAMEIVTGILLVLMVILIVQRFTKKSTVAAGQNPTTRKEVRAPAEVQSSWGICQKCGEKRVIIRQDVGLCAFCWSTSGTKPLA